MQKGYSKFWSSLMLVPALMTAGCSIFDSEPPKDVRCGPWGVHYTCIDRTVTPSKRFMDYGSNGTLDTYQPEYESGKSPKRFIIITSRNLEFIGQVPEGTEVILRDSEEAQRYQAEFDRIKKIAKTSDKE